MPVDAIPEIDFLLPLSFTLPAAATRVSGRSVAAPQLVVSAEDVWKRRGSGVGGCFEQQMVQLFRSPLIEA